MLPPNPHLGSLALAIAIALGVQAHSASAREDEQASRARLQNFDIPAGALGDTLGQIARKSGRTLSVDPALLEGLDAPAIRGQLSPEDAARRALAGTGLELLVTGSGTLSVQPVDEKTAQSGGRIDGISLDAMTVEDNALGTITENTKSYTPGTIATATRLVLTPRETPQTVTVVTRQHMDDFNLTSMNKVMEHTPGITVTGLDNGRTEYYARGYAITNFQYDGIPIQYNSQYASGNTLSDMIAYDRVEIIKGASGLTTGAGKPGATLNLVRKKPTHELSGHATAEAGRWDNYRTEWDIGGPLTSNGSIRGRIAGAFQDKQSFQDHYKNLNKAYYGIMEMDLSPQTLLTFGADYNKNVPTGSSWAGVPVWDTNNNEINVSRSYNPGADWASWEQYSHSFFTQLDHDFDNGWTSRAYYTFQVNGYDAKTGSIYKAPNAETGTGTLSSGHYRGKTKSHAIEIYASGPFQLFGREHELVIGASAYRNHLKAKSWSSKSIQVDDFYNWDGDIQRPDWGAVSGRTDELIKQNAIYTTARFKPTDELAIIIGGRITNYHMSRDQYMRESGEVIPFCGVVYDVNDNLSFYASYTKIFQPQNVRDESYSVLQPDEGDSYEGGVKGEWFNGRLNASMAYFEIRQDNRAESVGYDYDRNYTVYRGTKAKTKGVELEVSGELLPNWNIQTGFTHQVIREDATREKLSTQAPENQFKIYTTYRLPGIFNKLIIGGGANYQGTTWRDGKDNKSNPHQYQQEAYWLVNLMGKYQITDKLSTTLNINNLFDKYYYTDYGSTKTKIYGEPRNMMLTTRWDF
ncbi:TonB-dependent siderophore receptor [Azotobacter vinelandii]|uniref:TonB-dependent siderophore receptor n=1 Tax=Azotobacter vinelandii TaxID=354 RepID=UPI0009E6D0D7|nr:TonB-dependent receptor [Azotobacter vinelandii]